MSDMVHKKVSAEEHLFFRPSQHEAFISATTPKAGQWPKAGWPRMTQLQGEWTNDHLIYYLLALLASN